jgi:NADH-quinone oxidoreductase subunit J
MLLGAESLAPSKALPWQKPLAYTLAVILVVESVYLVISRAKTGAAITSPDASINTMESLREMAMTLFGQYLLPFEITSILLLVAMVGAIVLSKHEKEKGGQS